MTKSSKPAGTGVSFQLYISEELRAKLGRIAHYEDRPIASVVRRALEALKEPKPAGFAK